MDLETIYLYCSDFITFNILNKIIILIKRLIVFGFLNKEIILKLSLIRKSFLIFLKLSVHDNVNKSVLVKRENAAHIFNIAIELAESFGKLVSEMYKSLFFGIFIFTDTVF